MDVRTLCLGVLSFGDATGYEIKKYFEEAFSHFFVAGFGSIYPALAELADEGMVRVRNQAAGRRPGAKVYQLTEAGRTAFVEAIVQAEPRHKVRSEFLVILYFAHMLPAERLQSVLDERLRDIDSLLAALDRRETEAAAESGSSPGIEFVAGFGRTLLDAARTYIKDHRHELDAARDVDNRAVKRTAPAARAGA
jgi:DNA-binding PadR family transcriptional regulator